MDLRIDDDPPPGGRRRVLCGGLLHDARIERDARGGSNRAAEKAST